MSAQNYSWDASGNLTGDGLYTYQYDGAGRLCAALKNVTGQMTGYLYNADGRRVAKGTITPQTGNWCDLATNGFVLTSRYVLNLSGETLTEFSNGTSHSDIPLGDGVGATLTADANTQTATHFQFTDWLGTRRVQTDALGSPEEVCSGGAFGDGLNCTGQAATDRHFTGKERDTESGLDYFGARYYASNMGRWMSPDWSSKPQPVPYASLMNPQSLNLYAYVDNNPLSQVDADGHFASPWHFLLTFVAALATGHDPIHAAIWGVKNAAVDFRHGSQSGDPAATHVHAMAAAGESTAQAYAGTAQTLSQEQASGDIGGAQHTIQDSYASGHDYSEWAPQDGAFGGLGFWGTVKHELGDWLPSPGALWGL